MSHQVFEYVVVGAGVHGSSAAYWCSKNGKTLLLEQFELLHSNGSSHGNSRIIRCSYDDPLYSKMGLLSIKLWEQAEKESHMKVYYKTGGLDFGPWESTKMQQVLQTAKQNSHLFSYEYLKNGNEIAKKFPAYSHAPQNYHAVYQPDAGILNAQECCRMLQYLAAKQGCLLHEREKVTQILTDIPSKGLITIVTDKSFYTTQKLILCCGTWSKKVLQHNFQVNINLEPLKMSYMFWKLKPESKKLFSIGNFPIFIHWESELYSYGFPEFPMECEGHFKCAQHFALDDERNVDPDNRSYEVSKPKFDLAKHFLNEVGFIHHVEEAPFEQVKKVTCLYEMSPKEDFIIDTLPKFENIAVMACGSGHSFKFGIAIGLMLKQLVDEPHVPLLLNQFDRTQLSFSNNSILLPPTKL